VGKEGDKVVIRRVDNGKEYTISPDSLSEGSQKLIQDQAKNLKAVYPPLEADVVIGTRRKPSNGSSYMRNMEVSAKVTLTNTKVNVDCPPCTGTLLFVGQDQSFDKDFKILSSQKFEMKPTKEGTLFLAESFSTIYDSDNKGEGNLGGFKYEGYLLVVRDQDGTVILTKTVYSKMKNALENDVSLVEVLCKLPTGTQLNESMKKN
jgi:hypothetical protein